MLSPKHQVRNNFATRPAEWAACYADPERGLSAQALISRQRFALEMVEATIPPSSKILDVGCGAGVLVGKLMERGYAVWGLDLAEPMIRYARELCGSDQFAVGDIEHLPFPDNTFDLVVTLGVIEYLESDERALHEMWRVLRPGGQAVIAIPNGGSPLRFIDGMVFGVITALRSAYDLATHRLRRTPAPSPSPGRARIPRRRFYRRTWLRLLRTSSFEPMEWICHGWGWFKSPLGSLVQRVSKGLTGWVRPIERLFGRELVSRASDRFVRSWAVNWLAAEQVVRVRSVKEGMGFS